MLIQYRWPIAALLVLHTLIFGVWLLLPLSTFDSPTFAAAAQLMSEEAWGILFLMFSLLAGFGLLAEDRTTSRIGSVCIGSTWLVFSVLLGWSDITTTAVPTYFIIGLIHLFLGLKTRR